MSALISVQIHASQFPEAVRRDLLSSLRERKIQHKFHYDSVKQAHKWLALHEQYSPARRDADCLRMYETAFENFAAVMPPNRPLHVLGLGCGGGQKDLALLQALNSARPSTLRYTANDVSTPLVLVAYQRCLAALPATTCTAVVCDLATAGDLHFLCPDEDPTSVRILTFFGMLPNFEPGAVLPRLRDLLRPNDLLLLSANLAPGPDYNSGMQRVLPQYDNAPTRQWLLTFLYDLGIEPADGRALVQTEQGHQEPPLQQVVVNFEFTRERSLNFPEESFRFQPGDRIRLFFSYRHTPGLLRELLVRDGLHLHREWLASSGEEGLFLVRRQ